MKKIITMLAIVVYSSTLHAQTGDLEYGVKAGFNLSTMKLQNDFEDSETTFKPGFQFGGFARTQITEILGGQIEILFSQQGTRFKDRPYYAEEGLRFTFSYIQIPVLARYDVNEKLSLEAGPQIGFLIGAKSKWEAYYAFSNIEPDPSGGGGISISDESGTMSADISEFYKGIDLGLVVGADYKIQNGISGFIRYHQGIINVSKYGEEGYSVRNSVFTLGITYLLSKL